MKNIAEIENKALDKVFGGCYCYCYKAPISSINPTVMIGKFLTEDKCRTACNSNTELYLGFCECKASPLKPMNSCPLSNQ